MLSHALKKCCRAGYRNISYVARSRMLMKLKEDNSFCEEQLSSAVFLPYAKGKPLLTSTNKEQLALKWLDSEVTAELLMDPAANCAVLGVSKSGIAQFALNIAGEDSTFSRLESRFEGRFTDLRVGLFMVDQLAAHTLTKGWSLLQWKRKTKFCSSCGKPLVMCVSGSSAKCSSCSSVFYPSTSPVGIVSISDPVRDSLLLVRLPRYPAGMYSCIAGFLDPGETLEECVRREAAEEVGVEVEKVIYLGSQHWPFPAGSLMIGCQAQANPGQEPDPCRVELEDARWFSRQQVQEAYDRVVENPSLRLSNNDPAYVFIPPHGTIANLLIKSWLSSC